MIIVIALKELKSMFASPLAWVVLAFVQGFLANIFLKQVDTFMIIQAQLARTANAPGLTELTIVPMFGAAQMVLLMSIPLLTMRLISEEKRNQTMALLVSAPISMTQIIMGKFLAMVAFLCLILFTYSRHVTLTTRGRLYRHGTNFCKFVRPLTIRDGFFLYRNIHFLFNHTSCCCSSNDASYFHGVLGYRARGVRPKQLVKLGIDF
jgi:hypothetical protein